MYDRRCQYSYKRDELYNVIRDSVCFKKHHIHLEIKKRLHRNTQKVPSHQISQRFHSPRSFKQQLLGGFLFLRSENCLKFVSLEVRFEEIRGETCERE